MATATNECELTYHFITLKVLEVVVYSVHRLKEVHIRSSFHFSKCWHRLGELYCDLGALIPASYQSFTFTVLGDRGIDERVYIRHVVVGFERGGCGVGAFPKKCERADTVLPEFQSSSFKKFVVGNFIKEAESSYAEPFEENDRERPLGKLGTRSNVLEDESKPLLLSFDVYHMSNMVNRVIDDIGSVAIDHGIGFRFTQSLHLGHDLFCLYIRLSLPLVAGAKALLQERFNTLFGLFREHLCTLYGGREAWCEAGVQWNGEPMGMIQASDGGEASK